jgi:hypothetical protein
VGAEQRDFRGGAVSGDGSGGGGKVPPVRAVADVGAAITEAVALVAPGGGGGGVLLAPGGGSGGGGGVVCVTGSLNTVSKARAWAVAAVR